MKRGILLLLIAFSISSPSAQAQFFKKLKDKINQKIEDQVDNTIDKTTDDVLNKKKSNSSSGSDEQTNSQGDTTEKSTSAHKDASNDKSLALWNKYDFIPGETIFFYDDFKQEQYGEFPSKWDLAFGSAEIAKLGDEKITQFKYTDHGTAIFPLISEKDYIKDYTTIEMDIYFDEQFYNDIHQSWIIGFYDISGETSIYGSQYTDGDGHAKNSYDEGGKIEIQFSNSNVNIEMGGKYSSNISKDNLDHPIGWHHIAIAFNDKNFKLYIDEHKMLNIPQLKFNPFKFYIYGYGRDDAKMTIKNIKFAKGGGSVYQQIITDGKYSTNGILFDSGQAKIKSQSQGVIKAIADILIDNPDWQFTIVGHTDNDGDETSNLKLSLQRAEAVKNFLIEKGISADRLKTEGKGETQPLNRNANELEKANNRRVEFIKV